MGRVKTLLSIGILAIITLGLTTCDDPALLLQQLETDVMTANALFLEVVSITPEEGATSVNPGDDIKIRFDRAIDDSDLSSAIEIADESGVPFASGGRSLSYSFDPTSFILTISAEPYFEGLKTYVVLLKDNLAGIDGSYMQDSDFQWKFTTRDIPIGTIRIDDAYSNDDSVNITITTQGATYYAVSNDRAVLEDPVAADWQPVDLAPGTGTIDVTAEGECYLYAIFRDGGPAEQVSSNKSEIVQDSVVYDITPPVVDVGSGVFYVNSSNTNPSITGSFSDNLSGFGSAAWTFEASSGAVVFSSDTSMTTNVNPNAGDDDYQIRLTVTDGAGNSGYAIRDVTRDTNAPSAPIVSIPTSPTTDTTPLYSSITGETTSFRYKAENGSWNYFSTTANSYSPSVPYGNISIEFQSRDIAGNWSGSTISNVVVYPKDSRGVPNYAPSNGSNITGDLAWSIYEDYEYRVYYGTSAKGLNLVGGQRGNSSPYVDFTDLSLLINRTYYWKVEFYAYSNKFPVGWNLIETSPTMSFSTSTGKF